MKQTSFANAGSSRECIALVYGSPPGIGGLGQSVSSAIAGLVIGRQQLVALGPQSAAPWSLPGGMPPVEWIPSPNAIRPWMVRYSWLRWRTGQLNLLRDRSLGRWAAREVERLRPQSCFLFTQVALETLRWARRESVPTVLDNPNGHIRNFQEICHRESRRWFEKPYYGHPSPEMVERAEEEYELADYIRVYSKWGKASMMRYGVPEHKIVILQQSINLDRFRPPKLRVAKDGPLRLCYVGSVDLRKGFVYLLQAIRAVGSKYFQLRICGSTGGRDCARLLARESTGLQIHCAPGDSLAVYQQSELFALPTLEDGLPFVLVEAQACGLPVITTGEAGAAESVVPGESGWIVAAGQVEPLAAALNEALRRREELWGMGQRARENIESYSGPHHLQQLSDWFYRRASAEACL